VDPILAARRRREARSRTVRNTLAVLIVLGVLGPLTLSWLTHQSLRRSLARDLGWTRITAPESGRFMLGCVPGDKECSPHEKRHEARLEQSFGLMTHEVTVGQFRRFLADAGSTMVGSWRLPRDVIMEPQPDWNKDDHPVVRVSWFDASAFCEFVGGRLPTEAEWEYAARGGNADRVYPWGDRYSGDQANGFATDGRDEWRESAPVKSFPPNGYGLHDMIGNAWEWTSSVYRQYPYQATDGREDPASREAQVVRGGSWDDVPEFLRVSLRFSIAPAFRNDFLGFRCARDGSP
jgi:formylglycine-generating enzyme required for sulfatase activity